MRALGLAAAAAAAHLREGLVRALGALDERTPLDVARLASAIAALPAAARGGHYRSCIANLGLLGIRDEAAERGATRHVATALLRDARFLQYEQDQPAALLRRARRPAWHAADGVCEGIHGRPPLIGVVHTGEYRLTVAHLIERYGKGRQVFVPVVDGISERVHRSLKSLEHLGYRVDVSELKDPTLALTVMRRLRNGQLVIGFVDLPSAIGRIRFGEPRACGIFGRQAQLAGGLVALAHRAKADCMLVGHRMDTGPVGAFHAFARIAHGGEECMQQAIAEAVTGFVDDAPHEWHYLPFLEAYFHRQLSSGALRKAGVPALSRGGTPWP
ncbi:hypothetical protein [Pseudoxanthomonas sp.]|jgi:hypothetical protein|uniref:hypothetical protein n=1 Tax=Pseudoxanthomonas sp. TaxID=1871049 RepID=UPI002E10FB06|nr:hypothetical protein [Pseudoxanthomonas sp.]